MTRDDETKTKLRELRDKLAFELPRARVRSQTAPELVERMKTALDSVHAAYAMPSASAAAGEVIEEARQEAIVEAHLVLHEWERRMELQRQPKVKPQLPTSRRASPEADVVVKLLRYRAQQGDGREVAVGNDETARAARNLSADGMFVMLAKDELPQIAVGGTLQLSTAVASTVLQARATVVRRDANGIALRWIADNERTQRAIASILDAVRRSRKER